MRGMRKRLWLAAATILVLVGILASGLLGVSRANFERIHDGMTLEEVVELLGQSRFAVSTDAGWNGYWHDGPDTLNVYFDADWKVNGKKFTAGKTWERIKYQFSKRLPASWQ